MDFFHNGLGYPEKFRATCLCGSRPELAFGPFLNGVCNFPSTARLRATRPAYGQQERAMADQVQWQLSGDYFENCSCTVVCPCLVSTAAPLTSRPTEGVCNVPLIFHIDSGRYGDVALDGLNVALAVQTPGPMAD